MALEMEAGKERNVYHVEDDHERQGTVWTGTAHVVTAVIGSGVLALPWSVAQLGWVAGPLILAAFSGVTLYTSTLLADCYRYPTPAMGKRNHTYMGVVRAYLGPREVFMCGVAQYINLWGTMVGYNITATASMIALQRSNCLHRTGHSTSCRPTSASGNMFMVAFGVFELVLSQFPSLEKITWISVVAAVMSFAYSAIGLFLCVVHLASHGHFLGGLRGAPAPTDPEKTWMVLQALGNIAFAYTYAEVLIEIQDTLKSPPAENKTMKRVTTYGIGLTTAFYLSLGSIGYAAFGNAAPGNLLTGFGDFEPFWLVDVANICLVVHLVGAYQVFAQPIFACIDRSVGRKWPEARIVHASKELTLPFLFGDSPKKTLRFQPFKIVLRSLIIVVTTLVAMLLPFFNAVLGLLGALSFWPLTVFFPVTMHMVQNKVRRGTSKWFLLHGLSFVCLCVSVLASIGSVADIVNSFKHTAPFKVVY